MKANGLLALLLIAAILCTPLGTNPNRLTESPLTGGNSAVSGMAASVDEADTAETIVAVLIVVIILYLIYWLTNTGTNPARTEVNAVGSHFSHPDYCGAERLPGLY